MSKLLIDEEPLQVLPSLAKAIGLNEALFLQQLHYWLQKSKHEHDERRWTYNTYEEWHEQFPFWSLRTMQRIVRSLLDQKLIVVHQFTATDRDQKNWYSVEYDELRVLSDRIVFDHAKLSSSKTPKRRHGIRQNGEMDRARLSSSDHAKMASSYTESNTEKEPTENTPEKKELRVFEFYKTTMGHSRTILTDERRKLIARRLRDGYSEEDLRAAIQGCKLSAFHQGDNDRATVYDSLELIFKDAKHIESFIARAESGANGNGNGKPRTQSERNVANIQASLDIIRSRTRQDHSQESAGEGITTTNPSRV